MSEKSMEQTAIVPIDASHIRELVYTVRGVQVMLDADLARLYQVETKNLNKAANRNTERFPEDFRFQLTKEEYESLRFQFGTSNEKEPQGRGGRRYYPYVYTEQGISMLSSVLRSSVAINVSVSIMRAFVEMRRFIAHNAQLFERIERVELKQLTYQKETDEKFEQVFDFIHSHTESSQKIFFDGQIYDAFSLLASLIQKATKDIILIDGYVDIGTLNLLAKNLHLQQYETDSGRHHQIQQPISNADRQAYQRFSRPIPDSRPQGGVSYRCIPQGCRKEVFCYFVAIGLGACARVVG